MEILKDISITLQPEEIRKKLHIRQGSEDDEVQSLIETAQPLIRARATYKVCYIEKKLEDAIDIDGIRFKSRVLRKNVDKVERVFPYVITIGNELQEKARTFDDVLKQYYFDVIGNIALTEARKYFEDQLRSMYALAGISRMSPGSLTDWPIEEQSLLFSLLGNVEASIGVKLSRSLVMIPQKSISGIYFPTKVSFYSCQLCPRKRCPSRKTGYDKEMAGEYGILEMLT
jgi:hypothetical protein